MLLMKSMIVSEIEINIFALPTREQRLLIARVSKALRQRDSEEIDRELLAMANDPGVQREIKEINEEFQIAEMDGLDK